MLKMRREGKEQKKNILLKQQTQFAEPLPTFAKPTAESGPDNPEWLISEDWALLQAVKQLLELPLNLTIVSPAHTPNWDLVSDVVNSCSRIYRSSKQCRSRYENVLIPREEGKVRADPCTRMTAELQPRGSVEAGEAGGLCCAWRVLHTPAPAASSARSGPGPESLPDVPRKFQVPSGGSRATQELVLPSFLSPFFFFFFKGIR
ncbi:E1A-binding protein p400-like [Ursus maritimus]|uniref:E1A-binding protein p400-like n=1 Tax=Ursus maritimus TaxID=29073 RepID=A0A8M1F501_URSMA|nr:E1A-binding protein p400-like [Ursus maritimus]